MCPRCGQLVQVLSALGKGQGSAALLSFARRAGGPFLVYAHPGMPSASERVVAFLVKHKGSAFCDNCLRMRVGLARQQDALEATKAVGSMGQFKRATLRCFECGTTRSATRAA
jgi:hypothetical protein